MRNKYMFMLVGAWLSLSAAVYADNLFINFGPAIDSQYLAAKYNPAQVDTVAGDWMNVSAIAAGGSVTFGDITIRGGQVRPSSNNLDFRIYDTLQNYSASYTGGGIIVGTAPGRNGVYVGSSLGTAVAVAGLDIGQYEIYVVSALCSTNNPAASTVGVKVGAASYGTAAWQSLSVFNQTATESDGAAFYGDSWVEGVNYVKFNFEIASAGDVLYVAGWRESATVPLNLLQIIAVPEPATWAMLLGGVALLAALRRRRAVGK